MKRKHEATLRAICVGVRWSKKAIAAAPLLLGPIECQVRAVDQPICILAVLGEKGDAHACTGTNLPSLDEEGLCEGGDDLAGQHGRAAQVMEAGLDDGELVPTNPGHRVGVAQHPTEPPSDLPKQAVARLVAELVVTALKPSRSSIMNANRVPSRSPRTNA
jgi:hypothetical protein